MDVEELYEEELGRIEFYLEQIQDVVDTLIEDLGITINENEELEAKLFSFPSKKDD